MRAVLLVGLVACGAPTTPRPAIGNVPPPTPAGTVAERLQLDVGKSRSVAILAGAHGLRAVSSDGAREFALTHGSTWFALIDTRANVVWYGVGTQIRMIDLDAPAVTEVLVVDNVPVGYGMVGPQNVSVSYIGEDPEVFGMPSTEFALTGAMPFRSLNVFLSKRDGITFGGDSGYEVNDEYNAAVEHAKVVLALDVARNLAARNHHVAYIAPTEIKVPGVDPAACVTAEQCGTGTTIPGTHFAKILVSHVIGDVGHFEWKLWDTSAKRFVDGDWFEGLEHASLAPDRSAFVSRGGIIRFDNGPLKTAPIDAAQGGGFLGGTAF